MSELKKCLIVVDYQNDFVSGTLGFPDAAGIENNIAEKIKYYRKNSDVVMFTFDTHSDEYMDTQEGRNLPVEHCMTGTDGHKLYGKVGEIIRETDMRFLKASFGSGELHEYLKKTPFQSIELVGVVSNICVISNAVLAKTAQPETPVIVDAGCVASNDGALNSAALDVMASMQIEIKNRG